MEIRRTRKGRWCDVQLLIGGKAVSNVTVSTWDMRIGSAVVKMGGIGGVWTDKKHRMKGYARRVMEDAVPMMQEEDFDVAALFGIPDFYHKFGFAVALPEYKLTLATREAERAEKRFRTRKAQKKDWGVLLDLYAESNQTRTGSAVRSPSDWNGFRLGSQWHVRAKAFLVTDDAGAPLAYAVYDDVPDRCAVAEVGYRYEIAFETIVHTLARRAVALRTEKITLSLPPDHPFAVFCRRYGCDVQITYPRNGNGMMRIIHLRPLMQKICPVLEERVQRSLIASAWQGRALIHTDIGAITLVRDHNGLHVHEHDSHGPYRPDDAPYRLDIPQSKLIQWIMGYRPIHDLLLDADVTATDALVPLLEILFPSGYPHIWWPDRF